MIISSDSWHLKQEKEDVSSLIYLYLRTPWYRDQIIYMNAKNQLDKQGRWRSLRWINSSSKAESSWDRNVRDLGEGVAKYHEFLLTLTHPSSIGFLYCLLLDVAYWRWFSLGTTLNNCSFLSSSRVLSFFSKIQHFPFHLLSKCLYNSISSFISNWGTDFKIINPKSLFLSWSSFIYYLVSLITLHDLLQLKLH